MTNLIQTVLIQTGVVLNFYRVQFWEYLIFATYQDYDVTKTPDEQPDKYDPWEKSEYDFYEEVIKYYEQEGNGEVKCFRKGPECDSESDGEGE